LRTRRGLSLIEVVVAIVILGLAVPPLMLSMAAGVQQQEESLIQQELTQLASERMWEVFTDHANPTRGYAYLTNAAYPDEDAPHGLTGYLRQIRLREVSAADYSTPEAGSGLKRFRIIVTGPRGLLLTIDSFVADIPGAPAS
jgi:prepilin-type N-terminal cleavage/methylation domain-containing protein